VRDQLYVGGFEGRVKKYPERLILLTFSLKMVIADNVSNRFIQPHKTVLNCKVLLDGWINDLRVCRYRYFQGNQMKFADIHICHCPVIVQYILLVLA
jgi:hypothetical protein